MSSISLISEIDPTFIDRFNGENKIFYAGIVANVNRDISVINSMIQSYNDATDQVEKQRLLKSIFKYRQEMAIRYPLDFIGQCRLYRKEIQDGLWTELKSELNALAIPSITTLYESGGIKTPVTEYFSNMPQHKMAAFMSIYWENLNVNDNLDRLFSVNEPGYEEFRQIRASCHFKVISGKGNSRNILIEYVPPNGLPPLILKVDARLGNPKEHEQTLRDASFSHLAQIHGVERQASFKSGGDVISANLVLTDYFPGGSLKSPITTPSNTAKTPSELARLTSSALNYFQQMTAILLEMQSKGVAFPDPKLANWLVDKNNKLWISDTKSFLSCELSTTMISENVGGNRWTERKFSRHLYPEEFQTGATQPYSADKMHAYMVGKNLYQYLTGCDNAFLLDYSAAKPKNEFLDADFGDDVFGTEEGIRLRTLIQKMVQPQQGSRIGLNEALHELNSIIALQKCRASVERIKGLQPNYPDLVEIQRAIEDFGIADRLDYLVKIDQKLNRRCDAIGLGDACQKINTKVEKYLNTSQAEKYRDAITIATTYDNISALQQMKAELTGIQETTCDRLMFNSRQVLAKLKAHISDDKWKELQVVIKIAYRDKDLDTLQQVCDDGSILNEYYECRAEYAKVEPFLSDSERGTLKKNIKEAYNSGQLEVLVALKEKLIGDVFNIYKQRVASVTEGQAPEKAPDEVHSLHSG